MKIRSTEFLAAVAIITSATVLQIREHMPAHEATSASAQTESPACRMTRDGLVPAACEPTRDDHQEPAMPRQRSAPQIWV
ncbi:hypothetical protein DR64_6486 [Paraburkholderia xenovorans LB400]|nr:hypothetical protein [Paraburkholderia xenovorans]AIP36462.1 hypothetical protein DR64_6486 [Paraburkholderia xenovorans LB400]